MRDFSVFQWVIFGARVMSMGLAASFAAALIRVVVPRWRYLTTPGRAWAVALLVYSVNVSLFVALVIGSNIAIFPDSVIWAGFAVTFALFHRALYASKSEEVR